MIKLDLVVYVRFQYIVIVTKKSPRNTPNINPTYCKYVFQQKNYYNIYLKFQVFGYNFRGGAGHIFTQRLHILFNLQNCIKY